MVCYACNNFIEKQGGCCGYAATDQMGQEFSTKDALIKLCIGDTT